MTLDLRLLSVVIAAVLGAGALGAQQAEYTNNFKYHRGQSVQPIFEGWSKTRDGRIQMHFGYLNRNYVEQPHIPIGANNRIEPGGPDRGQPTLFNTRTNRNLFTVLLPMDWGKTQELVWTVTVNGKSERAVGWLQPEWEIDPWGGASGGGNTDQEFLANKPPALVIAPIAALTLSGRASLAATVTDDGLPTPKPKGKPPVGQETPPTLVGGSDAPVNVPELGPREAPRGTSSRPDGVTVSWTVWRGPAPAIFEPRYAQPVDGVARTTATFTAAGEYVLRASALDGAASTNLTVSVKVLP